MDNFNRSSSGSNIEKFKSIAGIFVTCLGIAIIIIGLKYCIDIFGILFDLIKNPERLNIILTNMVQSLDWEAFNLTSGTKVYPVSSVLALLVYGGVIIILAFLSMSMMSTGSKIVSWTIGDRQAVKEILQYAFGETLRPKKLAGIKKMETKDSRL
ncbi:Uncharacterized protein dnl_31190 [Desulfonema limicola]|uniref:Uncharacterized protein n=1 Tax=Desulfonema limicola TaxID=45656 RepID=A0A975B8D5_9BACT|nr:hypothetical protein [Desulfonema limicola]QTA80806.1 Uncharacterized protein dnl_31190 [Desulfonema limicola]